MHRCKTHKGKLKTRAEKKIIYEEPSIFLSRQPSTIVPLPQQLHLISQESQRGNLYQQINAPHLTTSVMVKKEKVQYNMIQIFKQGRCYFKKKPEEILLNDFDEVIIDELISQLKNSGNIENNFFDNAIISVYNEEESKVYNQIIGLTSDLDVYTTLGKDPIKNCKIRIPFNNPIRIKVTSTKSNLLEQLLGEQSEEDADKKKDKKERQISEVVEKVALWRRLYTGFYDQNKTFIQMPLNDAAKKVNIAKKTLDDYLLQIRCGKRYGFDFNQNRKEKIGKLRSYVKDYKKIK